MLSGQVYEVVMLTPMGDKPGTLKVDALSGKVTGTLTILGKSNPLSGTIQASGRCNLTGSFSTLLMNYRYVADGIITGDMVTLEIVTTRASYSLRGMARTKKYHTM